jgi:hypothetical protein
LRFSYAAEFSRIAVISAIIRTGDWGWARLGSGRANSHLNEIMAAFEFVIIEGQNLANQPPCPILPAPSRNESTGIGFEVVEAFVMIDATHSLFLSPCPLCQSAAIWISSPSTNA